MLDAIFGSVLFNALVFAGGIASMISLLIGVRKYRRSVITAHVLLVVALSFFSAYSYFSYQSLKDATRTEIARKALARQEAASLLSGLPSDVSHWQPGEGRGIALSGLAFLEQHRDIYPTTFELTRSTVRADIEAAQNAPESSEERHRMEVAGVAMLRILRGIAGNSAR